MAEKLLVKMGREYFQKHMDRKELYPFLDEPEANAFLNDLDHYPHAFVLAGIMDRQQKSEKCWEIPCKIKEILGSFEIDDLADVSLKKYRSIFDKHKLHCLPDMSEYFYAGVHRIMGAYKGDAAQIWKGKPSSAKVVYEFLQFNGIGVKIATMLTNILARDFHIPFSDLCSIDISTDTHVMRVMQRTGLIDKDASKESAIYKARELCPEYPGIFDHVCWEIGRKHCKNGKPDCKNCPIERECDKKIL